MLSYPESVNKKMDNSERDIFMLNQHGEGSYHADLPRISLETHDHSSLAVPGQEFNFDFENRLIHDDDEPDVNAQNERNTAQTTKEKRAHFRQLKKRRRDRRLLQKISSGSSSDYAYENFIALEGVKNEYPAIVVSSVVDGEGDWEREGEDINDCHPSSSSMDLYEDDPLATIGSKRKRKRSRPRKFSVASALTDISFGGQSSSSKVRFFFINRSLTYIFSNNFFCESFRNTPGGILIQLL